MGERVICIIIVFLIFKFEILAQSQSSLDSLQTIFPKLQGENRYNACDKLSYDLAMKNDTLALLYCHEFLKTASALGDSFKIAFAMRRKGVILRRFDHTDSALIFYKAALGIAERNGLKEQQRNLLNSIGITYLNYAEYEKSLDAYDKALVLSREAGDSSLIGIILNNIGLLHYKLENSDLSIRNLKEALLVKQKIRDSMDLDRLYINMGLAYRQKMDFDQSERAIRTGLDVCGGNCSDRIMAEGLLALGVLEQRRSHFMKALQYLRQCHAYALKAESRRFQIEAINSIGNVYVEQKAFNDARRMFNRAETLSQEHNYKDLLLNALRGYIDVYKHQKDYAKVVHYQGRLSVLQNEIYSMTLSERIGRFQMEFEMSKRKSQIISQRQVIEASDKSIEYGYYLLIALTIAGTLFVLFAILQYRQFQYKQNIGRILQERVGTRAELLQTEEARVAREYDSLKNSIRNREQTIRTELNKLIVRNDDVSYDSVTMEYLRKIKAEAHRCLQVLR